LLPICISGIFQFAVQKHLHIKVLFSSMRIISFAITALILVSGCAATDAENSTVAHSKSSMSSLSRVVFAPDLQKGPYQNTVRQLITNPPSGQSLPNTMGSVTMYSSYMSAIGTRCNILGAQVSDHELPLIACQNSDGGWNVELALVSADSIFVEGYQQ